MTNQTNPTKILIIEDDPFISSMYATKFEHEGYTVATAADGELGLSMIKTEKPDLILLDILLPKMNGFEILKNSKQDPEIKDIPVILLTNLNQKNEIEQGLAMGASDYLIKAHFTPAEVIKKIQEIIK